MAVVVPQTATRFIDLATDGGCSKKADAGELTSLLRNVAANTGAAGIKELSETFPDVGRSQLGSSECMATVDILFPMVPDAEDFGRIVANHVLGDVYAAFGVPSFALSIVGVPYGLEASSPEVTQMLSGAIRHFESAGVRLLGGHTLAKQADVSLGFAVVGTPMTGKRESIRKVQPGDPIFLTKPLGTSAATLFWKLNDSQDGAFQDVRSSMLKSSAASASLLYRAGVNHCTDVTGFGLVNHLHRLMLRETSAAEIFFEQIVGFSSLDLYLESGLPTSSLYLQNVDFASQFSNAFSASTHLKSALIFDAQVAGGLMFAYPTEVADALMRQFEQAGLELIRIGNVKQGTVGEVTIA
ncbi:selenide, water dikinase SelD [Paraburkholderia sediminicola]|uniref:selenide, water dikinase SelD n=1 Tax=Paraburkholderia sediminicola TaxID=458836 RepID=UPI0038B71424